MNLQDIVNLDLLLGSGEAEYVKAELHQLGAIDKEIIFINALIDT